MWNVKVGDFIVCVTNMAEEHYNKLQVGQIYTVQEITINKEKLCVTTKELGRLLMKGILMSHSAECFRPVSRTRTEEFRRLCAPQPGEKVHEIA